ncbi:MAG: ABC transporter permease [Candidatus Andeanibacterium colombiense]|uniref:ABC transporter permease n=1 Tax=Candidatus Andeanibacterium colombiense TaxID=3121345 RepID=A0AAJ6BLT2_9SPHN|nr:MAG: ABC transporter permease [Sphingomonadaceae bacterium]
MSPANASAGRLSIWQAAFVIARRDFVAILFSRTFIFFLIGPLFPIVIGALVGGVGKQAAAEAAPPEIGVAMQAGDGARMVAAYEALAPKLGRGVPRMRAIASLAPGETFDAKAALQQRKGNIAAIVTGSPAAPVLTAPRDRLDWWSGPVDLVAAQALAHSATDYPGVKLVPVSTSGALQKLGQVSTAQAGQTLLFLLIVFLAGMVLSNLVEEKGNKIIEILAAAIPMDAVFLGKLFAMLAVSLVGIAVWASVIGGLITLAGMQAPMPGLPDFHDLPTPAVGWPLFVVFGVIYFAMGYLILGSIFLAVGSMAKTVREVQTLSMPASMFQILVFLFAYAALTQPGRPIEIAAILFPLSSPYAMLARAATDERIWIHFAAFAWQLVAVALFIRWGAALFRRRVMQSGPQARRQRRSLLAIVRGKTGAA